MHRLSVGILFLLISILLFSHAVSLAKAPASLYDPTVIFESPYNFETTIKNIKTSIIGKNFRLIREQKLDYGLVPGNRENPDQHIIYFCNFNLLNKALTIDSRVGLFLPCRITVVKQKDRVLIYAANPKYLSNLLNNPKLDKLCHQMNTTYVEIIEEAIL